MAIEYSVDLESVEPPLAVASRFARLFNGPPPEPDESRGAYTIDHGYARFIFSDTETLRRSVIREAFGFTPTIGMTLRIGDDDGFPGLEFGFVMRALGLIMQSSVGDVVAALDGELPLLIRIRGEMFLNSDYSSYKRLEAFFLNSHIAFEPRSIPII